jgi:hypothetical protein
MSPHRKKPVDERLRGSKREYLLELRTKRINQVGCDGRHPVIVCASIA